MLIFTFYKGSLITILMLFMVNSFNNCLPRRVAVHSWKLKSITAKIYKTASSIGFSKKSIYHEVKRLFVKFRTIY